MRKAGVIVGLCFGLYLPAVARGRGRDWSWAKMKPVSRIPTWASDSTPGVVIRPHGIITASASEL